MTKPKTNRSSWRDDPVRLSIAYVVMFGIYALYFTIILRNTTFLSTPAPLFLLGAIATALAFLSSAVKYRRVTTALHRRKKRDLERLETLLAGSAALLGVPLLLRFAVPA